MKVIERLADDPFQNGAYEQEGKSGRIYQVLLSRPFKITFWADHAVKEVRVVDIQIL